MSHVGYELYVSGLKKEYKIGGYTFVPVFGWIIGGKR